MADWITVRCSITLTLHVALLIDGTQHITVEAGILQADYSMLLQVWGRVSTILGVSGLLSKLTYLNFYLDVPILRID